METEYVTRAEFDLQVKNISDEDSRQNHRLTKLEEDMKGFQDMRVILAKISLDVEYMKNQIKDMRTDIDTIKGVPASRWDKIVSGLIGAVVTVIGGGIAAAIINYVG